ncbi:S8 family serine peptidase, partial [Methylocucumis oryzae]
SALQALAEHIQSAAESYQWQPPAGQLEQLLSAIDDWEQQTHSIQSKVSEQKHSWRVWLRKLKPTPGLLMVLLGVESLALVTAVMLLIGPTQPLSTQVTTPFVTLSTPKSEQTLPSAHIVFADTITEAELNQLLNSVHAQIVSGPSQLRVYRLAFQLTSGMTLGSVVELLRKHPKVTFVQPIS